MFDRLAALPHVLMSAEKRAATAWWGWHIGSDAKGNRIFYRGTCRTFGHRSTEHRESAVAVLWRSTDERAARELMTENLSPVAQPDRRIR